MSKTFRDLSGVKASVRAPSPANEGPASLMRRASQIFAETSLGRLDRFGRTHPAPRKPASPLTEVGQPAAARAETLSQEAGSWAGRALLLSFIAAVMAPTALAAVYFLIFASDLYVSETRFAVRAASEPSRAGQDALSLFGKLGLSGGQSTTQDAYILLSYLKSSRLIDDIGGRPYLEAKFSGGDIDYLSRLPADEPAEYLTRYFGHRVIASMDAVSGVLTVKALAFQPREAQELSIRVVGLGEKLINSVSERARAAAVEEAENETARAGRQLAGARAALQTFRNASVSMDPVARATSIGDVLGKLMIERAEVENTLATLSGSLSAGSPAVRIQKSRLDAINAQIAAQRADLASARPGAVTVADDLARFEQLKLDEQFAERMYTIAQLAAENARADARRQKLFLAMIEPPGLPEAPLFPERGTNILLTFAVCLALWGMASLATASVLDHTG